MKKFLNFLLIIVCFLSLTCVGCNSDTLIFNFQFDTFNGIVGEEINVYDLDIDSNIDDLNSLKVFSNNTKVAKIVNGKIILLKEGTAEISVGGIVGKVAVGDSFYLFVGYKSNDNIEDCGQNVDNKLEDNNVEDENAELDEKNKTDKVNNENDENNDYGETGNDKDGEYENNSENGSSNNDLISENTETNCEEDKTNNDDNQIKSDSNETNENNNGEDETITEINSENGETSGENDESDSTDEEEINPLSYQIYDLEKDEDDNVIFSLDITLCSQSYANYNYKILEGEDFVVDHHKTSSSLEFICISNCNLLIKITNLDDNSFITFRLTDK